MHKSDNVERAHLLVELAREAERLEENGKALSLYDDALSQFSPESIDPFLPEILRWKGTLLREKGETEGAFRCYTMSLEKARAAGSEAAQAHALIASAPSPSADAISKRLIGCTHRHQSSPQEQVMPGSSA